jgi:serine protease DegQ
VPGPKIFSEILVRLNRCQKNCTLCAWNRFSAPEEIPSPFERQIKIDKEEPNMHTNPSRFPGRKLLVGSAIALALAAPIAVIPTILEAQPAVAPATEVSLAPIVAKVTPAVVSVSTRGKAPASQGSPFFNDPFFRRFFEMPEGGLQPQPRTGAGSGVIVDARRGYIITNHHVIDGADEITVTLRDGRELSAKKLGSDKGTDIALLQVEANNLVDIPIGDSSKLNVGDYVIAIGNPFGLGHTVTAGIVSALGRSGLNIEGYEDFIQTDASINPGNSGGPLVNIRGEIVGINSAIIAPSGGNVGIGFAVPSMMMKSVMDQLIEHGEVSRGQIGITISSLNPAMAANLGLTVSEGALVSSVLDDSPADKAGVETGDVVTAVNGTTIRDATALRNRIGLARSGSTVTLQVLRDGRSRDIRVTIGKAAETEEASSSPELRPALEGASFSTADGGVKGVRVDSVMPGSAAERINLRAGDVITAVNRKSIDSLGEFYAALKDSPRQAVLFVKRGDSDVLIVVP